MPQFFPYLNASRSDILDHLTMRSLAKQMLASDDINRGQYRSMDVETMRGMVPEMMFREQRMEESNRPWPSPMTEGAGPPLQAGRTYYGRRGGNYGLLNNPGAPGNQAYQWESTPSTAAMYKWAAFPHKWDDETDYYEKLMRIKQLGSTPEWAQMRRGMY